MAMATCHFLERILRWLAGILGRFVIVRVREKCNIARMVQGHAADLDIDLEPLPNYSLDLDPIERLREWMRKEVTRGLCRSCLKALRAGMSRLWRVDQCRRHGDRGSPLAGVRSRAGVRGETPGLSTNQVEC